MENITLRVALKHNSPTTITTRQRETIFWMKNLKAICFSHSTASHWLKTILWLRLLFASRAFVCHQPERKIISINGNEEGKTMQMHVGLALISTTLSRPKNKSFSSAINTRAFCEFRFSGLYLFKILWMPVDVCRKYFPNSCIGQIPIIKWLAHARKNIPDSSPTKPAEIFHLVGIMISFQSYSFGRSRLGHLRHARSPR